MVSATVKHYQNRVFDWEIWNEPNNIKENLPEMIANLSCRTLDLIKAIQPDARISILALGSINLPFADEFLKIMSEKGKLILANNITYHGYCKNPDEHYGDVAKLRVIADKYLPGIKLRQGENGAPSKAGMGGAISDYDWTELSQAKWDTRRMLGDLGRDIESSVFTIIDLAYNTDGPIKKLNVKGLLESDNSKKVIRPKLSYQAVQHITSIFDDRLERILDPRISCTINDSFSAFAYRNKLSNKQVITIWTNSRIPTNENQFKMVDITTKGGNFSNPVYVDIITGKVSEIPSSKWKKNGNDYTFYQIPVYDAPVLIVDRSLLKL